MVALVNQKNHTAFFFPVKLRQKRHLDSFVPEYTENLTKKLKMFDSHTHTHTHSKEARKVFTFVLSPVAVIIEVDSVRSGTDKQPQQHKQVSQQRLITMHLVLLPQLFQKNKACSSLLLHFIPPLAVFLIMSPSEAD